MGGCGLLFECLARLGNQARVLHCDHCLRCKVLQQGDLLVGEWPGFLAENGDAAKQDTILAERYVKDAAVIAGIDQLAELRNSAAIHGAFSDVLDEDDVFAADNPVQQTVRGRLERRAVPEPLPDFVVMHHRRNVEQRAVITRKARALPFPVALEPPASLRHVTSRRRKAARCQR